MPKKKGRRFPISAMTERKQYFNVYLLLSRGELGDIGVVAVLHVLVGALRDGLLLCADSIKGRGAHISNLNNIQN